MIYGQLVSADGLAGHAADTVTQTRAAMIENKNIFLDLYKGMNLFILFYIILVLWLAFHFVEICNCVIFQSVIFSNLWFLAIHDFKHKILSHNKQFFFSYLKLLSEIFKIISKGLVC